MYGMHIAIFIYNMSGYGAPRRMLTLINEFVNRGHRLDLVFVKKGGPLVAELSASVRCFPLKSRWASLFPLRGLRKLKIFLSRNALANYLRRERPDVLLSAASHASLTALAARRSSGTGTPLVLRLSTHLTASHAGAGNVYLKMRYRRACRRYAEADAVIAVSRDIAEDIASNTGLARERITTIYNPAFTGDLIDKLSAPLDHPWFEKGSPPVILGVGRLAARKDFSTLLKAFAAVRGRRPARLAILGEGGRRKALTALAQSLNIAADVDMPGFVDNPLPWMSRASVFVLSSTAEGLPGVLVEAMAAGCRIVSTDCPSGPAEILANGKYGRLVPVGDSGALARAIEASLDAPHDPQTLRMRAAEFSVDKAVDDYLAVLSRAIKES
ncbi:glycosyltransferase, group 1 family protein [delta proteobacterium NaphS2]|nr:glycosyltransferase, group 1 family protein [delta proteobacterium NaphS2]